MAALSEKQLACLRQVHLLGHAEGFAPNTLRSLEAKGLVQPQKEERGGTWWFTGRLEVTEEGKQHVQEETPRQVADGFELTKPVHCYLSGRLDIILQPGTLVRLLEQRKGHRASHRMLPYRVQYANEDPFLLGQGHTPVKIDLEKWEKVQ